MFIKKHPMTHKLKWAIKCFIYRSQGVEIYNIHTVIFPDNIVYEKNFELEIITTIFSYQKQLLSFCFHMCILMNIYTSYAGFFPEGMEWWPNKSRIGPLLSQNAYTTCKSYLPVSGG